MNNSRGFSLMGALLGMGVLGLLSMGIASVMSDASLSTAKLAQKLELLAFKADLTEALANPSVCSCQLQGVSITAATGLNKFVSIPTLKAGCDAAAPTLVAEGQLLPQTQTQIRISKVELGNFAVVTPGNYRGVIRVTPDPSSTKSSFRPIMVSQSFQVNSSGQIVACTFDSFSAKSCSGNQILVGVDEKNFPICRTLPTCAANQLLLGYDTAGNPTCKNLPSCSSGRVLNSVKADGSPVCIDGSQIANIPTQTTTTTTASTSTSGSSSTSTSSSSSSSSTTTITEIIQPTTSPPPSNFPTTTTLLGTGGNPTCAPGEAKKDAACSTKCISQGALSGAYVNASCDKGQLQCLCANDMSRFPLTFTSSTTGLLKCPTTSVANAECNSACIKGGKSGGSQESCIGGVVQCICK